jgi:uncharacterized protein YaaQ
MLKKRCKKGQVTVFIIIGIMLIFIFLFLFQISSNVIVKELERGQEGVFSKIFQKEALRIFVEDCLEDELREAIILSGKQGRIWDYQPGGSTFFQDGVTGVQYLPGDESRVAYYVTKTEFSDNENAYPCVSTENSPFFCRYEFPGTLVKFGEIDRWENNMEKDIAESLKIKAQECINIYLEERVSNIEFTPADFNLNVDLQEEGIFVEAFYPLSFNSGGDDFFHLSVFDFFYPTGLRRMLRSTLIFPMIMDWRYADFNYTKETLTDDTFTFALSPEESITRPTFKRDYEALEISLDRERIEQEGDTYGDTIYTFTSPFPHVLDAPNNYTLRVARQNRPPALDYVHRAECPAGDEPYDYLIVPGDDTYGNVDIQLVAYDPDEDYEGEDGVEYFFTELDELTPTFTLSDFKNFGGDASPSPTEGGFSADLFKVINDDMPSELTQGRYTFIAKVTDKFGLEDWQEVHIFVDRPINPESDLDVGVNLPYEFMVGTVLTPYVDVMDDNVYFVSGEDPIFISVTVPEESAAESAVSTLTYTSNEGTIFEIPVPDDTDCIDLPSGLTQCDLTIYPDAIEVFDGSSDPGYVAMTNLASTGGTLNIGFSAKYCGLDDETIESEHEVTIKPKQCLPHRNENHLIPYVPIAGYQNDYKYFFEDGKLKKDVNSNLVPRNEELHPFETTHACCKEDYIFEQEGTVCYTSPNPTCENVIQGYTIQEGYTDGSFPTGYVLSSAVATCSGRGNVCGGDEIDYYDFYDQGLGSELRCGNNQLGCSNVISDCKGALAWSFVKNPDRTNKGFCMGTMGCSNFCGDEDDEEVVIDNGQSLSLLNNLNEESKERFIIDQNLLLPGIHCECGTGDVGKPCSDGSITNGRCLSNGKCSQGGTTN